MNYQDSKWLPLGWNVRRFGTGKHDANVHDIELTSSGEVHHDSSGSGRNLRSSNHPNHYSGWRKTVSLATGITFLVLIINIILISIASSWYPATNGIGVLYTGDCGVVKRWNTVLHLLINLLSTCLLAASSYTMQCLGSPTRSEIDNLHAKRKWMEIGLPSLRNIRYIKKTKAALWLALCLSTLPLHLFFNSTVFQTIGAMKFSYIVVDESFLEGAEYLEPDYSNSDTSSSPEMIRPSDLTSPGQFLKGYRDGLYTRMTVPECLAAYGGDFVSSHRNLIAVTKPSPGMRMSPGVYFPTQRTNLTEFYGPQTFKENYNSVEMDYIEPLWNGSSVLAIQGSTRFGTRDPDWLCKGWLGTGQYVSELDCTSVGIQQLYHERGSWSIRTSHGWPSLPGWIPQMFPIEYCLAESRDIETCQLQYVPYIFVIVIFCNVIKVIAMGLTVKYVWNLHEPILATVGDALESFLTMPDSTTRGYRFMSLHTVKTWMAQKTSEPSSGTVYNRSPISHIYYFTTKTRWWWTMTLCTLYLFAGYSLLVLGASAAGSVVTTSSRSVWSAIGLGVVTQSNTLAIQKSTSQFEQSSQSDLLASILVANTFQLALSISYFLFNSLWTAQCAAKEWARYASTRKPLRVTWPRGLQISTYYLSLPYRYGVPLIVCLASLHFLISQSIYLARVQFYNADGTVDESEYISDAAYSPLGILCTVLVATVLVLVMVVHSMLPYSNIMPPHGNCSAVISAMCHPGTERTESTQAHCDTLLAEKALQWGVINCHHALDSKDFIETRPYCAFSADEVERPIVGHTYY